MKVAPMINLPAAHARNCLSSWVRTTSVNTYRKGWGLLLARTAIGSES